MNADTEEPEAKRETTTGEESPVESVLLALPTLSVELVKRVLAIAAVIIFLIPPLPLRAPAAETAAGDGVFLRRGKGSLALRDEWITLHLAGTPYEMGYQHGAMLGPQIRWLLAQVVYPSLLDAGIDGREYPRIARTFFTVAPADIRTELQGVADGAGVTLTDAAILNLWADLLLHVSDEALAAPVEQPFGLHIDRTLRSNTRIPREQDVRLQRGLPVQAPLAWSLGERSVSQPAGGMMLAVWGEGTVDNRLLLAGQLGSLPREPYPLLVERRPTRGLPVTGVTLPGWIGVAAGMNAEGMGAIAARSPSVDQDYAGVPPFILVRLGLERAETADQLLTEIVSRERTGGAQVLIGDGNSGQAIGVELSARQFRMQESENPWLLLSALPRDTDIQALAKPAASDEWLTYHEAILTRTAPWLRLNAGFIGRESVETLLTELGARNAATWSAVIGEPDSRRLWISQPAGDMPAPASGYVSFTVEDKTGTTESTRCDCPAR